MAVEKLNSYSVTLDNGSTHKAVAKDLVSAAKLFETEAVDLFQITRQEVGVAVNVPEAKVPFTVEIDPPEVPELIALPNNYTVDANTEVLFQASCPENYTFVNWTIEGEEESTYTDQISYILIKPLKPTEVRRKIVAHFTPTLP